MNTETMSGLTFSDLIQSVPVMVSLTINGVLIFYMWTLLRKHGKDPAGMKIMNHTILLMLTWIAFSVFTGLFTTFEELESRSNSGLLNGFLYGFRIAMAFVPGGLLVFCMPVIWSLNIRARRDR